MPEVDSRLKPSVHPLVHLRITFCTVVQMDLSTMLRTLCTEVKRVHCRSDQSRRYGIGWSPGRGGAVPASEGAGVESNDKRWAPTWFLVKRPPLDVASQCPLTGGVIRARTLCST